MTEYQREDDLLADLLDLPEQPDSAGSMPVISRSAEQALLSEAYQAGTPTLTPDDTARVRAPDSFAAEIVGVVRRYPLPAVLAGAGLMLLLARRRR
jgi:hypothetical protein